MLKPFHDLNKWERELREDKARFGWTWFDWVIVAGAVIALALVLSCSRTVAPVSPEVQCAGYAAWGDAWCECMWEADSTFFNR